MNDIKQFWSSRFKVYIKEMKRYTKLIFNDHMKFVLVFGAGGGAFYYQEWLSSLPMDFPAVFIISLFLAFFLTVGSIRTFFKNPDLVFLIPLEYKLEPYIMRSFLYSTMIQAYILSVLFGVFLPLYIHVKSISIEYGFFILLMLIILKSWNLWLNWRIQYFIEDWVKVSDWVVRLSVNFVLVYFIYEQAPLGYMAAVLVICLGLFFYYNHLTKNKKSLKWEQLVEKEESKMTTFYRIANLFTDVPHIKQKMKRRKWLDWTLNWISYKKDSTFVYLFLKTFVRSNEYIGLYIRLLVIGLAAIYFINSTYGRLFVFLFILYVTGYQLITLWRHHRSKLWIDLYPVSTEVRRSSFLKVLFILLIVQSTFLILGIFLLENLLIGCLSIIIGGIFAYLFVFVYVKRRIRFL